jgi:hypothetical protein
MAGSNSQRPGTNLRFLLAFILLSVSSVSGEQFWDGAISYQPPFPMFTNSRPLTVETILPDWEFYTTPSHTNRTPEIVFHVGSLDSFLEGDKPATPITNVSDLKRFLESSLASDPLATNFSSSIIEIGGRQALIAVGRTNWIEGRQVDWFGGAYFFWESNAAWQKSTLCAIKIAAVRRETLYALTNSLTTIKIKVRPQKN